MALHADSGSFPRRPALFVSNSAYLAARGQAGGVQLCTREYLQTLRAAGFDPDVLDYVVDRRFLSRVRRLLWPDPYRDRLPPTLLGHILERVGRGVECVFLNQVDLAPLS